MDNITSISQLLAISSMADFVADFSNNDEYQPEWRKVATPKDCFYNLEVSLLSDKEKKIYAANVVAMDSPIPQHAMADLQYRKVKLTKTAFMQSIGGEKFSNELAMLEERLSYSPRYKDTLNEIKSIILPQINTAMEAQHARMDLQIRYALTHGLQYRDKACALDTVLPYPVDYGFQDTAFRGVSTKWSEDQKFFETQVTNSDGTKSKKVDIKYNPLDEWRDIALWCDAHSVKRPRYCLMSSRKLAYLSMHPAVCMMTHSQGYANLNDINNFLRQQGWAEIRLFANPTNFFGYSQVTDSSGSSLLEPAAIADPLNHDVIVFFYDEQPLNLLFAHNSYLTNACDKFAELQNQHAEDKSMVSLDEINDLNLEQHFLSVLFNEFFCVYSSKSSCADGRGFIRTVASESYNAINFKNRQGVFFLNTEKLASAVTDCTSFNAASTTTSTSGN